MDVDLLGALLPVRRPEPPPPPAQLSAPVPKEEASWGVVTIEQNPTLSALYGLAGAVAVGVSYGRNQSVPWAILHGLVGVPYLAYVGWETHVQRKALQGGSSDEIPSASSMFLEGEGIEELIEPEGSSKKKRRSGRR